MEQMKEEREAERMKLEVAEEAQSEGSDVAWQELKAEQIKSLKENTKKVLRLLLSSLTVSSS